MILLISTCAEKLHELEFVKPIEEILKNKNIEFKTVHYKKLNKNIIKQSNKIIICGTSLADNQFVKDIKYFKFIKNYNKPLLGICAGMDILGAVYGSEIKEETQIGPIDIEFIDMFLSMQGKHQVYSLHNLYTEFNPDEFKVYAYLSCPQAVKHKTLPYYGVLFHPEVRNKKLIEEFAGS